MKPAWITLAIVTGGFAAGLLLPVPERGATGSEGDSRRASAERHRETRKRAILDTLFNEEEKSSIRISNAANLSELFGAMQEQYFSRGDAIRRMIEMDPASAMSQLLADEGPDFTACQLAEEWARRDPGAAIHFLRRQPAGLADSALCAALITVYGVERALVGETLRMMDRRWQARNLDSLFGKLSPLDPQRREVPDPFASYSADEFVPFGADLLDCLADGELRKRAEVRLGMAASGINPDPFAVPAPYPDPPPVSPEDPHALNPERWSYAHEQALRDRWKEAPDETLAEVAASGCIEARREMINLLVRELHFDPEKQAAALGQLEGAIQQLGVIPEWMPRRFSDSFVEKSLQQDRAAWIARQPLALQRQWTPQFAAAWSEWNPRDAIEWALALPAGAHGDAAVRRGLIAWTRRDPLDAVKYVEALPPGELRESAVSDTAATWGSYDPSGARAWLQSLPESPGKTRGGKRIGR